MVGWLSVDWQRIFIPSEPIFETIIRGSCMYLALFALLRLFRRQTGTIGPADLLVLLLIADAAQNGLADDYKSITDGVLLVATIIGWEYLLDWLGFRAHWMQRVLERTPLLLIRDGEVQMKNLSNELITLEDLLSQLRRKGIESPEQVKRCFLEGDGHVSVIPFQNQAQMLQSDEDQPK